MTNAEKRAWRKASQPVTSMSDSDGFSYETGHCYSLTYCLIEKPQIITYTEYFSDKDGLYKTVWHV